MRVRFIQGGLWAAILLGTGSALFAASTMEPAVKKSRAGICHEKGTHGYDQTIHFQPLGSLDACLKSGGRLPKNSAKKPLDLSKPRHAGDAGVLFGPLVRVKDGDTLAVKIQGAEMDFRLSGIDAPELDQPFGSESRDALAEIIGEKLCVLLPVDRDAYGRMVAYLWVGELNVNEEMMSRGMAWFDSEYAIEPFLYQLENEAREGRRGLWALPKESRVEPWIWRKDAR